MEINQLQMYGGRDDHPQKKALHVSVNVSFCWLFMYMCMEQCQCLHEYKIIQTFLATFSFDCHVEQYT